MNLRSMLGGKSFGIRLMRDGKHQGNLGINAAPDRDEFDLSMNSTANGISVSAAVTVNEIQVLAYIEQLTEAVRQSRKRVDADTEPEGAA